MHSEVSLAHNKTEHYYHTEHTVSSVALSKFIIAQIPCVRKAFTPIYAEYAGVGRSKCLVKVECIVTIVLQFEQHIPNI